MDSFNFFVCYFCTQNYLFNNNSYKNGIIYSSLIVLQRIPNVNRTNRRQIVTSTFLRSEILWFQRNKNADSFLCRITKRRWGHGTSGKFSVPRDGIYSFSVTGNAQFLASSSIVDLDVHMYLNGASITNGQTEEVSTAWQDETWNIFLPTQI